MFGIDPVALARKELVKVDLNRDNVPDVFQALDAAEAGLDSLAGFISTFDADELTAALVFFNQFRKEEKRWPLEAVKEAAGKIHQIPPALLAARAALEMVEQELKRK